MAGPESSGSIGSTNREAPSGTTRAATQPQSQRDTTRVTKAEIEIKQRRLAEYLDRHRFDGVFLQHRANFAWVTGGRDNHIANNTPEGVAGILATSDGTRVCLANAIEAPRMEQEELAGTGIEVVSYPWHDRPMGAIKAIEVIAGRRIACDMDPLGLRMHPLPADFAELRWSLTEHEIARYRVGGSRASIAVEEACRSLDYGDTEQEIAGMLDYNLHRVGLQPLVTLVAADERIGHFRHPIPTAKTAEHYVMLVTCAEYGGLISCLTRFVSLRPMVEMQERQQALANIDAAVNLSTRPGRTLRDVFTVLQKAYEDNGYDGQWQFHHQGGSTGYLNREVIATPDSLVTVRENQAFAWNPSVPGAKSEDTVLVTKEGIEVLTAPSDDWPKVTGRFGEKELARADILVR